ncbi:MAG: hypothetical protein ACLR0U_01335 [Enterocloster clostridioformis]
MKTAFPPNRWKGELTLMVMEEMEQNWDDAGAAMDAGSMDAEAAPSGFWRSRCALPVSCRCGGVRPVLNCRGCHIQNQEETQRRQGKEDVDDEDFLIS